MIRFVLTRSLEVTQADTHASTSKRISELDTQNIRAWQIVLFGGVLLATHAPLTTCAASQYLEPSYVFGHVGASVGEVLGDGQVIVRSMR